MTFIDLKLELPDRLAREAREAGLLSPRGLAKLIRKGLRQEAFKRLAESTERVREAGIPPMSLEEIQEVVNEVRKERRTAAKKAA